MKSWLKRLGPLVGLVFVFVLFAILTPSKFATISNLQLMLLQTAVVGTAALGMTMVIISGGIDLSVGSVIALTTVVVALLLNTGAPPLVAAGGGVVAGMICGSLIGLLVTKVRLAPFIVTLGMWGALRGAAKGLANEQMIVTPTTWLAKLLNTLTDEQAWMLLPAGVWMMLILAVVISIILKYTKAGTLCFCGRIKRGRSKDLRRSRREDQGPGVHTRLRFCGACGSSPIFLPHGWGSHDGIRDGTRYHCCGCYWRWEFGRRRRFHPRQSRRSIDHDNCRQRLHQDGTAELGSGNRRRSDHRCRCFSGSPPSSESVRSLMRLLLHSLNHTSNIFMSTIVFKFLLITLLSTVVLIARMNPGADKRGAAISIIPKPLVLEKGSETFTLTKSTNIAIKGDSGGLQQVAEQLAGRLRAATGYPITIVPYGSIQTTENSIVLALADDNKLGPEGYRLKAGKHSVLIEGLRPAGVFYGVQTFYQLLPVEVESNKVVTGIEWSVPCVRIEDAPRFPWRGMHLDVGRHFFSKDSVKRYLDLMASYKMNTFHWHLTEDQGWRIEIKKYPRLTTVGAWRRETMGDCTPHGGFYTQDDVREIVNYARDRFITVVPEIEMPGHSLAALAAYPELSCSGGPFKVGTEWGVINDVYCAGNEKTFQFLEDVIDEVAGLFPGPFFHIGGDECPKLRWSNCKRCQERMVSNGLKNEQELQSYFVKRIEKMLAARGKRLVGWDEILEGGIAPNATVMSWRGIAGGIEAAKSGHDVVMTPTAYCYFDYYQALAGEPKAIGAFLPIDTVYSYEPIPPDLSPDQAKHVLGAQGNVWSEWMPNYREVEYMASARMMALSEVVWSDKAGRNLADFLKRMTPHYKRLSIRDVNVRIPAPLGIGGHRIIFQDTVATMNSPVPDAQIYYTLDGRTPSTSSQIYSKPIPIKGDQTLTAILVLPGGATSHAVTASFFAVDPHVNGVRYNYFEGVWDLLPELSILKPTKSGQVFDISLEEVPRRWGAFALQFRCYVDIPNDGDYTLWLASDDRTRLYLDERELIHFDGTHGMADAMGKVNLVRGKHKLEVCYYRQGGAQDLSVYIEGPGMPKQPLPPRLLTPQ